jgi:hypothetical protein
MAGLRFSPARPGPGFTSSRLRGSCAPALCGGGRECRPPRSESARAARAARAVWRPSRPPRLRTLNTGSWRTLHGIALPAVAASGNVQDCSRLDVQHVEYFWPASPKQMLDSCRASAQAVGAAPSGGSASAAAPMRPTSCGDGHGTTGADCRQDRRGTRSGFGVAAFSRTARSGAASGAASVRQGPVSAPPDGVASRRDLRRSPVRVFGPLPVLPEGGCFCAGARTVLGHCSESSQADEDRPVMAAPGHQPAARAQWSRGVLAIYPIHGSELRSRMPHKSLPRT